MSLLIIGCGDTGRRVARLAQAAGQRCVGVVRTTESARRLAAEGVEARQLDLDDAVSALPVADRVLVTAPPPRQGTQDTRIRRVLAALQPPPQRLVYISTSGVYGDHGGAWVDETAELRPTTPRALRRADAEQQLQVWSEQTGVSVCRLRVPGIYGPGRLPVQRLQRGLPVIRPAEAPWSNRIHVEDLARVCWLALTAEQIEPVYNVSDGQPSTMTEYFLTCARLLNLPEPPQIPLAQAEQSLGAQAASFVRESRRLRTQRLREGLGFEPIYPDLVGGVTASLGDESG